LVTRAEIRALEKGENYFFEFLKITQHFFKDLPKKLKKVKDRRSQSYTTYDPDILLFLMIIKNMAGLTTMRRMTEGLNKEECIKNIQKALHIEDLEELPHYDTINDFLSILEPAELEKIRDYMIRELLKKRSFEKHRLLDKYWRVIVDGTGLHTFNEKHCEHCLKKTYTNKETGEKRTIYMHHVLEAKLVVGDMVFSIATEFIENEDEEVEKQDCELNAFIRLAKKLKQTFKRLPICILGDSLYACETVFQLCQEEYKWKYLLRFKDGRIPTIADEFTSIKELIQKENHKIENQSELSDLFWVNDISYKERKVNMMEGMIKSKDKKDRRFVFVTNINITERNAEKLIAFGRSRWKIENEGFNQQKNINYDLEHVHSHNYTAMKNHYLLIQITDIIRQLYEKGATIIKRFNKTAKEKSSSLLEAIRCRILTDEDITALEKPIQVRFT
jgi:hypothetical protein